MRLILHFKPGREIVDESVALLGATDVTRVVPHLVNRNGLIVDCEFQVLEDATYGSVIVEIVNEQTGYLTIHPRSHGPV